MSCYDAAGPWDPGRCAGGLTPGAGRLGAQLVSRFGGSFQGYSCRPNTADDSQMSVHGTGRAVDYFPPSMAVGRQVRDYLIANASALGIQMVIYDRRDWSCYGGTTSYGGPDPHTSHLHIELTVRAAGGGSGELPNGGNLDPGQIIPGTPGGLDPGGAIDAVAGGIRAIIELIERLLDPNTWRRLGLILAGALVAGAGAWTLLDEIAPQTIAAAKRTAAQVGAAVATKGASLAA